MHRVVRALTEAEIPFVVGYFLDADHAFLEGMGVDPARLPARDDWLALIASNLSRPFSEKEHYYVGWELDGEVVGHSNVNKIVYGSEAYMHLHLWHANFRGQGHGIAFLRESVRHYFERFALERLYCQPRASNPGPNRTLKKLGFQWLREEESVPGWINLHQKTNLWGVTQAEVEAW